MNSLSWILVLQIIFIMLVFTFCLAWIARIVGDYKVRILEAKRDPLSDFIASRKFDTPIVHEVEEHILMPIDEATIDAVEMDGYSVSPVWDELQREKAAEATVTVATWDPLAVDLPSEEQIDRVVHYASADAEMAANVYSWCGHFNPRMHPECEQCCETILIPNPDAVDIPNVTTHVIEADDVPKSDEEIRQPAVHSDVAENRRYAAWKQREQMQIESD